MAHRCSYCGKAGHKRPTCPARSADAGRPKPPEAPTICGFPVGAEVEVFGTGTGYDGRKYKVSHKEHGLVGTSSGHRFYPVNLRLTTPESRKKGKKKDDLTCWSVAEQVIPHSDRILLYGPPGTGKTTVANRSAKGEVFNVTLTEEMPAAELRGHFVPKGGEFVWMDGPAMQAYRNGGRLVLNEIDRGSADALIFCYALLDDRGISRISLPTGEHVLPHEEFSVVATMNGEPGDLPEALQDRFQVRLLIDKPHPDAMLSLPDDLREAAGNSVSGEGESRVSFRSWKAFADLRNLVDEETAARAVFGNRATSILDTLKLARVAHTEPHPDFTVAATGSFAAREDTVAGFLPGDLVRVNDPHSLRHNGKDFFVSPRCGEKDLAAYFAKHGYILVAPSREDEGAFCFKPEHLELISPA